MSSKMLISPVELQEIAGRIKSLRKSATQHAIEIGHELLRVKERLPHGEFVKWVEAECEFKIRMAQDLMKMAREMADNPDIAAIMTPSTLRVYLSNRSNSAVQELVNTRAGTRQPLSRKGLCAAIAEARTRSAAVPSEPAATSISVNIPAKSDLLTAGDIGAETELDKSRRIAELLMMRLSPADMERIMEGMTWGVWNRVLVWLRADVRIAPKGAQSTSVQGTKRSVGACAA